MHKRKHKCIILSAGTDIFVVYDGVRIAKRGYPDTPQARTWVPLEPGWSVLDAPDGKSISVEHNGVKVH